MQQTVFLFRNIDVIRQHRPTQQINTFNQGESGTGVSNYMTGGAERSVREEGRSIFLFVDLMDPPQSVVSSHLYAQEFTATDWVRKSISRHSMNQSKGKKEEEKDNLFSAIVVVVLAEVCSSARAGRTNEFVDEKPRLAHHSVTAVCR